MVGIVVVSHSRDLARAAVNLALQMVHGPAPRIEIAAGTSDDRLGTDATAVAQAVAAADDGDGVVVIMDLGSAVLSAELALELLPEPGIKTRLVPAGFVEGIFAAVISAAGGAQLDTVAREARGGSPCQGRSAGTDLASGGCRRHDHASGGSGCEGHHRQPRRHSRATRSADCRGACFLGRGS